MTCQSKQKKPSLLILAHSFFITMTIFFWASIFLTLLRLGGWPHFLSISNAELQIKAIIWNHLTAILRGKPLPIFLEKFMRKMRSTILKWYDTIFICICICLNIFNLAKVYWLRIMEIFVQEAFKSFFPSTYNFHLVFVAYIKTIFDLHPYCLKTGENVYTLTLLTMGFFSFETMGGTSFLGTT